MTANHPFLKARQLLLDAREDYDLAYRTFEWPQLDSFNWALDWFDTYAAGNPRPALRVIRESGEVEARSFAELSESSTRVAHALRQLGVKRGDRILVMLGNAVPLWETVLAAMKLGAVVLPATSQLSEDDLRERLERGGVAHVVTDAECAPKFASLPAGITRLVTGGKVKGWRDFESLYAGASRLTLADSTRATDPFLLYFTSGTTARPKQVLHSHQSYPVGHLSTLYWIGIREGDVHLNISSPGWAKHAWSSVFAPWIAGACVVAWDYRKFDPARLVALMEKESASTLCAPPTVWRMLIAGDLGKRPSRLREAVSAGEPLNPEVIDRVKAAWGITVRDGFGQTESTAQVGNSPGQLVKPGAMGRPLPGYRVVLLDGDGREVEEGELALRLAPAPLGLMQGYADDPERSKAALGGAFYRTGDEARRDADGYYFYSSRADDVFKSADYRLSPFELESALIEHPAVAEAAVIPSPDPIRLNVPKAFLVLRTGWTPGPDTAREIFEFIAKRLSPYKRVRRVEFGDLPKTVSGKIRRVELRQREAERRASGKRGALEFFIEDFPKR